MLTTTFAAVADYTSVAPRSIANGTYCVYCKTESLYTDTTDRSTGNYTIIGTAGVCREVEILLQRTYCTNCGIIQHEVYEYRPMSHPNIYYDPEKGEYYCRACTFHEAPPA